MSLAGLFVKRVTAIYRLQILTDLQILQIVRGEKIQRSKRRSGRIRNVKVWIFGILDFWFIFSVLGFGHDSLTKSEK